MDLYAIYLRKSRVDLDAERSGAGETLKRHETALLALAKQKKLPIGEIYREIVSGETISGRPEMQRLLSDVELGRWKGVLCMEESRLARGDTMDQGRVQQAFYYSRTLIITPGKTFDPGSEADQEYFEFGLFMSRREYKMINRRLQRGRLASVKEGKWIGAWAPYGYQKTSIPGEKGKMLTPIPEQAEVVKNIYRWFAHEGVPIHAIAERLNELGVATQKGNLWACQSVRDVLENPVYCGLIRCGVRKIEKVPVDGVLRDWNHKTPAVLGENLFRGRHEPLITPEDFQAAQDRRALRPSKRGPKGPPKSPFTGLLHCANCGRAVIYNPGKYGSRARVYCQYPTCRGIVGTSLVEHLEELVLASLRSHLAEITMPEPQAEKRGADEELLRQAIARAKRELDAVAAQKSRAFDLVEQGVYTPAIFTQRMEALTEREESLRAQGDELQQKLDGIARDEDSTRQLVPKLRRVVDLYPALSDPAAKNELLKSAIRFITYFRPKGGTPDDVILKIYYLL